MTDNTNVLAVILKRAAEFLDAGFPAPAVKILAGLEEQLEYNTDRIAPEKKGEKYAVFLARYLAPLFPGMFNNKEDMLLVNQGTMVQMEDVAAAIVSHNPKYSNGLSRERAPFDFFSGSFSGSTQLVGTHNISIVDRCDYSGNAALIPFYKQILHTVGHDGLYAIPDGISGNDLPGAVRDQIAIVQTAAGLLSTREEITPLSASTPQILLPDPDSPTGYLSITPIASMSVVSRINEQFDAIREKNKTVQATSAASDTADDGTKAKVYLKTAPFLPAVGKPQNISPKLRKGARIFHAPAPIANPTIREAIFLNLNPVGWVGAKFSESKKLTSYDRLYWQLDRHLSAALNAATIGARKQEKEKQLIIALAERIMRKYLAVKSSVLETDSQITHDDLTMADMIADRLHMELGRRGDIADWRESVQSICVRSLEKCQ